ncbi:pyrimidine dimer DNA glycosylase/endonuclease V [Macrococcus equi]|uniref:pyrimidine dimer DNA glycosylase/endonuclease V n=1 Tax=Macrococcus equi TaxID=3395462 RepID=UPI0039BE4E03
MQIFRVSEDHETSARFLDNRRLSKQVLELYQIIRVCLAEMHIIEGNTRYLSHPIVKHIYNNGHPYLLDCFNMLKVMDAEHTRRGGKRSDTFKADIAHLESIIDEHRHLFNQETIPPFYVYGTDKINGEHTFKAYEQLLHEKWMNDKIAPRCGVKINEFKEKNDAKRTIN